VDELAFHRRPETLSDGVIVARSRSSNGLSNTVVITELAKVTRRVLADAIVMKDHPLDVTAAAVNCYRESPTHGFGAHVVVHGIANEATRLEVEDARDVEPFFVGCEYR
jgi:hypothetical protein